MEKEQYYSITLWDYALPSFVSGSTKYFGTLKDINAYINELKKLFTDNDTVTAFEEYINGNKDVQINVAYSNMPFVQSVELLFEAEFGGQQIKWTHKNVWDYDYNLRASAYQNRHIWIRIGENQYLRCIKPILTNLEHENSFLANKWHPISSFCGQPGIIKITEKAEGEIIYEGMMYFIERAFDSLADVEEDYINFKGEAEYKDFCNDIFGDG